MSDHTPEHKEQQTQQGGMGGQKPQGGEYGQQQGGQKQGDMGGQQTGTQTERREDAPRTNV